MIKFIKNKNIYKIKKIQNKNIYFFNKIKCNIIFYRIYITFLNKL